MRRPRLQLAAWVLLAAAAAPATAAWTPPERASSPGLQGRLPEVATSADGAAVAGWVEMGRTSKRVIASVRSRGGSWERPAAISGAGGPALDPQVTITEDGEVVAVWRQAVRTRTIIVNGRRRGQDVYVVMSRSRTLDGPWGPVSVLSSDRQKAGEPALGIDERGGAVAAWHWGTGTRPRDPGYLGEVQMAELLPSGWGNPRTVSAGPPCRWVGDPSLRMSRSGYAMVWWQCDVRGGSTAYAIARDTVPARWSDAVELPFRRPGPQSADLGLADDGTVTAVSTAAGDRLRWWRGRAGASGVKLVALPAEPEVAARGAGPPALAIESGGDALSAWVDSRGRVRAAPIAALLGVGEPATLNGRPRAAIRVAAAIGDDGRAVVSWIDGGGGRSAVMARERTTNGSWGLIHRASGPGRIGPRESPRLAVDGAGGAELYWTRYREAGRRQVERASLMSP